MLMFLSSLFCLVIECFDPERGRCRHFLEELFQITRSCWVSDKYQSEVALKIYTVKDRGVRGKGVPEPLESPIPPSWLPPAELIPTNTHQFPGTTN